jgi:hypothetical protein
MSREKKRKGSSREGTVSTRDVDVQLAPTVRFLHENISEALCREVFKGVRTTERERKWSLFALARFWLAVILDPPDSLSQALAQRRIRRDPAGFLPHIAASAESFFQRCRDLSSGFFMALYTHFVELVTPKAPKAYGREVAHLQEKFTDVVVVDGSRLDKIAHRLKILREVKAAILPGCILAVYDLFRGFATQLWFDADAAASEFKRAGLAVPGLRPGTLMLGDRLYCALEMFRLLEENGCLGLFRRTKRLGIKKVRLLERFAIDGGGLVEDLIVLAGSGNRARELRMVRLKSGGKTYEAITDVMDPARLTTQDVLTLYPLRWTVERLFYDLKVVLKLERFYAANPNAVAMQVFAAAMVHVAFRLGQADLARRLKRPPEDFSPKKLYPLLATTSMTLLEGEYWFERTQKANPETKLHEPDWNGHPATIVVLRYLLVQKRSGVRKKKDFDVERRKWKSITDIDGAEDLT